MHSSPRQTDSRPLVQRNLDYQLRTQLISRHRSSVIVLYPFLFVLAYVCAFLQYCGAVVKGAVQFVTNMPLKNIVPISGHTTTTTSRARAESKTTTIDMQKQEFYRLHSVACTQLRTALDMDDELKQLIDKGDITHAQSKRAVVTDQYWKSITSLEKAIHYFANHFDSSNAKNHNKADGKQNLTDPELERARSTCEKMRGNKQAATERVERLESLQLKLNNPKLPLASGDNKNYTGATAVANNADVVGRKSGSRPKPAVAPIVTLDEDSDDDIDDGFNRPTMKKSLPEKSSARPKLAATAAVPAVTPRSRPLAVAKGVEVKPAVTKKPVKFDPPALVPSSRSISRSSSNNSIKIVKPAIIKKPVEKKPSSDVKADARNALRGVDRELADKILDNVLQVDDKISLDDVQGQEAAKQALHELVILPAVRPEIFTGLRAPIRGLLLYGPPGNGKTMLAKAVAGEAGLRFFNISASALTSKWIGDGEKLVRALFACAKILQPAVIFVDEIDSLLKSRSDSEHDSMRRLKTEFLIQFDGVDSSSTDRILVMGATNRPWELDEAATRRFPKRVYVQLPDVAARTLIIERLLHDQQHSLTKKQIKSLAEATEGYSGSDLTNLARDAALGPVRLFTPNVLKNIDVKKLRPINEQDFLDSLRRIRPSCSDELIEKLEQWSEQRGEG